MAIINNTWTLEHFQLKYKTKEQWDGDSKDYVLATGEIGLEIDTGKVKLGDGTKKWSELDYYSDPVVKGLVDAITERMNTVESDITTIKGRLDAVEADITAIKAVDTISVNPALAANG